MHKIFETTGIIRPIRDSNGAVIEKQPYLDFKVHVEAHYLVKLYPYQSLVLTAYGHGLTIPVGLGQVHTELVLDNGLTFRGRCHVTVQQNEIDTVQMFDVQEKKIELDASGNSIQGELNPEIDSAVCAIVNSRPLGHGSCSVGWSHSGFPFHQAGKGSKRAISTLTFRLVYEHVELCFCGTSQYWKKMIDNQQIEHDLIVGIRRQDRATLNWNELNSATYFLEHFLGSLNHSSSSIFHVKAYRKNHLVYRGYKIHPVITSSRDTFSWLPAHADSRKKHCETIQLLFNSFIKRWKENYKSRGTFHIALQMLRNPQKGIAGEPSNIGYLRDTYSSCAILQSMISNNTGQGGREARIKSCLKYLGLRDKLPIHAHFDPMQIVDLCPHLWWGETNNRVQVNNIGNLSTPLKNIQNWMLHIDNPDDAKLLLEIPNEIQNYFLEVSTWLADLMFLKVLGYNGEYNNRLSMETCFVPWAKPKEKIAKK